ncbi:MAG: double-strand break repair protein AddB, partial [Alphaproteobacteria bacterium]
WIAELKDVLAPLTGLEALLRGGGDCPLGELLARHIEAAEAVAATDEEGGGERLWSGEAGEALASLLAEARASADILGKTDPAAYPAFFDALLEPLVVRPRYGRHPRLAILGTLEARLFHADLMILGGLNEGSWPPAPAHDPWMSRAMRETFGLPPAARRAGQAAHDFLAAAGASEIVLTRSTKRDGTPTVPSRWLSRLDALAGKAIPRADHLLRFHRLLDTPARVARLAPPRPAPPLSARPGKLSVTQVETWMRDPYAIYARHILDLKPLDALEEDPGALRRGTVLHDALDRFLRERRAGESREAARERLLACGRAAFGALLERPAVAAFWWPRFEAIADAFLEIEHGRGGEFETLGTEIRGELALETAIPFILTAKADRIDRRRDGRLEIIDYKTGSPPSGKQIEAGFAPQLPLEGWMAEKGAFPGIPASKVAGLVFWHLKGTRQPIELKGIRDVEAQIRDAKEGLVRLVNCFADEATPYLSNPRPREAGWGEYDHLARVDEWTMLPRLPEESDA